MSATTEGTILVLEENAAVQELIDQVLRESGHRVLSTNNSLEALDVVRRVHVDVLVVGALLEVRRQRVVDELCSIQPGLEVVSICGRHDELLQTKLGTSLSAPFSLDELCSVVADALAAPESAVTQEPG